MEKIKIETLKEEYINKVVMIHIEAFPTFFLTFLGPKFLKEFYRSFLRDSQGIGFVALDNDSKEILGAIVGPLNPQGYYKRLLKRKWFSFCIASMSAVIKKPSVIKRLFKALFYRGEAPQGIERSLLSSIAVSPNAQGKGAGKALVVKWLDEANSRGSKGAFLTTDAENNDSVNTFYQKIGFKLESSYNTPQGRKMNRYIYDF